jgi:polar amino acid transport system substrate-binding protein
MLLKAIFSLTPKARKQCSKTSHHKGQNLALGTCQRLTAGFLVLLAANPVQSQQLDRPLQVVTQIIPPFVLEKRGKLVGFSIDLWCSISEELGIESQLFKDPSEESLLATVKSSKADLGIAAISITSEKSKRNDFSQPIFESGLQILVKNQADSNSILGVLVAIFSPTFLQLIGIILGMILLPAHIIWFFERHHEDGIISGEPYFPGIFKAFWWAAATLGAQAEEMPKSSLGRVVAIFLMFTSVVFLVYFTDAVTTALTVQKSQASIEGPADLPGKTVATVSGSISETYLREQKDINILGFNQITDAYKALLTGRADAVVFDALTLLYYASHEGKEKVQTVGTIFQKQRYGMVLPPDSPYRMLINHALLRLQENGTYQKLYDNWFSHPSSNSFTAVRYPVDNNFRCKSGNVQ